VKRRTQPRGWIAEHCEVVGEATDPAPGLDRAPDLVERLLDVAQREDRRHEEDATANGSEGADVGRVDHTHDAIEGVGIAGEELVDHPLDQGATQTQPVHHRQQHDQHRDDRKRADVGERARAQEQLLVDESARDQGPQL